ncbi:MAG TPA: helix-turn-helix domain-containing protein [Ktedonobacterales bacterium]|nr:helix-turn-helix domain-containing protein [Ktedonobacterales bacterium]
MSQRATRATTRKRTSGARNQRPNPLPDRFNDPGQPKMLLTLKETAERLNISLTSVSRRVLTGEIPSIKIGSLRRVPVPHLDAYLRQLVADQIPEPLAV